MKKWVLLGALQILILIGLLIYAHLLYRNWHYLKDHPIILQDDFGRVGTVIEITCDAYVTSSRPAVFFIFGQSNGASEGRGQVDGYSNVGNFYFKNGRCYEARDPLLGTSGRGAGPWIRMANKLIETKAFDSILLVPIAMGGTSIVDWDTGAMHRRLVEALDRLKARKIDVTYFLWAHGEADANGKVDYRMHFERIVSEIRGRGFAAPIYMSLATVCDNMADWRRPWRAEQLAHPEIFIDKSRHQDALRMEMERIADTVPGVKIGVDTDKIPAMDRYDGCHFGPDGLDRHAELWFRIFAHDSWPTDAQITHAVVAIEDKNGSPLYERDVGRYSQAECMKWRHSLLSNAGKGDAPNTIFTDSRGNSYRPYCASPPSLQRQGP